MAPYLDCISQGVCTVMASYSSWNGRKLHADHLLLTEVLKNKLGFKVENHAACVELSILPGLFRALSVTVHHYDCIC